MGGPHYHTLIKAKKSQVTLWKIRENSFGCMELCNFFMVMGGPHYNTLIKAREILRSLWEKLGKTLWFWQSWLKVRDSLILPLFYRVSWWRSCRKSSRKCFLKFKNKKKFKSRKKSKPQNAINNNNISSYFLIICIFNIFRKSKIFCWQN